MKVVKSSNICSFISIYVIIYFSTCIILYLSIYISIYFSTCIILYWAYWEVQKSHKWNAAVSRHHEIFSNFIHPHVDYHLITWLKIQTRRTFWILYFSLIRRQFIWVNPSELQLFIIRQILVQIRSVHVQGRQCLQRHKLKRFLLQSGF